MSCPSTRVYHDDTYLNEVWALFAIGTVVIVVRTLVRLRSVKARGFEGDDYMAIAVFACFLCDCVTVSYIYLYGSNVDFTAEQIEAFEPCQIRRVRLGSQLQLVAWYTYTALIWGLKAMMLFLFNRLTTGLDSHRLIRILAIACAASYLAVFLTISCGCFPIQGNWQVRPIPRVQCTVKTQNFYVTTVLNVVTDAAILCIPFPLIVRLRASTYRKLALAVVLCTGIFVIVAAILRIVFTFHYGRNALNINRWGTRETFAGIVAVNLPILAPLFRTAFWSNATKSSQQPISPGSSKRPTHDTHGQDSTYAGGDDQTPDGERGYGAGGSGPYGGSTGRDIHDTGSEVRLQPNGRLRAESSRATLVKQGSISTTTECSAGEESVESVTECADNSNPVRAHRGVDGIPPYLLPVGPLSVAQAALQQH